MKRKEHTLQVACVSWFRLYYPDMVIFSIPNGGKRNVVSGFLLKKEGTLKGVADLFVFSYTEKSKGLFVELKSESGRQTADQKKFEKACKIAGYDYKVVKNFEDFKYTIDFFLNL